MRTHYVEIAEHETATESVPFTSLRPKVPGRMNVSRIYGPFTERGAERVARRALAQVSGDVHTCRALAQVPGDVHTYPVTGIRYASDDSGTLVVKVYSAMPQGRTVFARNLRRSRSIYMTGDSIYWETDEQGDPCGDGIDEHGWVNPSWSRTDLYDNRDDVRPIWTDDDVADDETIVQSAVSAILDAIGTPDGMRDGQSPGGSSFYGQDSYSPLDDMRGTSYTYAVHCEGFTKGELSAIVATLSGADLDCRNLFGCHSSDRVTLNGRYRLCGKHAWSATYGTPEQGAELFRKLAQS